MWTVRSEIADRYPVYYVTDKDTGERKRGSFDSERIAQVFADYLNEREGKHGKGKSDH